MARKVFLYLGSMIIGLLSGIIAALVIFTLTSKIGVNQNVGIVPITLVTLVGMAWFSYRRHFDWSIYFLLSLTGIVIFEIWFI